MTATPAAAKPLEEKTNPARVMARLGALLGGCLALASAAHGSGASGTWRGDLPWMTIFAASSLIITMLGAWVMDLVFLGAGPARVSLEIDRGNLAAGIVRGAHRVAMGVVAASCLYGADLQTLGISSAFAGIGLVTLLAFQALHRRLTRYADDQEVRGQNVAAAVSATGLTVALAIIVGHAAEGTFTGWADSLRGYGLALLLAAGLYPVRQLLVKKLLLGFPLSLRGHLLDQAIAEERNAVVGAAEGLSYLAVALLVTGLL